MMMMIIIIIQIWSDTCMTWGNQKWTMQLQRRLTKLFCFKLRLCTVAWMSGSSTKDIKPSNKADILSVKFKSRQEVKKYVPAKGGRTAGRCVWVICNWFHSSDGLGWCGINRAGNLVSIRPCARVLRTANWIIWTAEGADLFLSLNVSISQLVQR